MRQNKKLIRIQALNELLKVHSHPGVLTLTVYVKKCGANEDFKK